MSDKSFSPVKNYVITLTSILQNDKESINLVSESLQTRGYSFIRLPRDLIHQIDINMLLMESFFLKPQYYKKDFFKDPIFGYFGVDHKESFRLLTGSRISEHRIPANLNKLKDLIHTVDQIMYSISLMLAPILFPNLLTDAQKLDIPFYNMKNQWGMFDVAKYHNDGSRTDINCKAHYDPGLLSLSLRSTQPGLQLKDEFGKWIKTPEDTSIAILWAGKAATEMNPKIKPGIHRVANPDIPGKPRISMWHEICTSAQEHKELIKKKDNIPENKIKSIHPYLIKKTVESIKTIDSIQKEFPSTNPYTFEKTTGIPMSKSMQ